MLAAMRISIVFLALAVSGVVHADLAPPPPEELDCPRGAKGAGNGVSVWCEPTTCANDVGCGDGYRCSEGDIGLCVESIEVATERVRPDPTGDLPDVRTTTVRSVRRRGCEPDGTCLNVDSTCEQARRCVKVEDEPDVPSAPIASPTAPSEPREAADAAEHAGGCACRTSGNPTSAAMLLVLFAFVRRRV